MEVDVHTRPPARRDHAMWLNSEANRLVIYGGNDGNSGELFSDIWEFDLGNMDTKFEWI